MEELDKFAVDIELDNWGKLSVTIRRPKVNGTNLHITWITCHTFLTNSNDSTIQTESTNWAG